uniref:Ig-like domain-containing protein n=1 Tax=Athene cunicularia TaxID=194338 RepID=A0A663M9I2_ATHCN
MPPRFAVPFADVKVTEGLEAVFECVVTGTPVPVVQWFRGNTCVTPATGKYVVSQKEGLHSLKVQNVSPLDGGSYQCRAINRLGEAMSVETVAASVPHKPQKCDLLLSKTVSPGDQSEIELEFEFKPRIDDSQKAIQLRAVTQKEQEVEGEKCVNISFDVFAEPSQEERVEFRAEDSESCSFEFQVTEAPPKFLRLISDYSTFVGASACFHCLVTGSPHPSIHWYKDGVLLEGDRYLFAGNDHSLILPYAGVQNEGEYRCVASNVHGEITCSAHLHVRQRIPGVPYFAREPDSVRCAPGFTAVFEYTVAGEPCPDVQWFKGTEQLFSDARRSVAHHPDGTGSLTVWECMEEDTGLYMCRAVSTLGEAEMVIIDKPHFIKVLQSVQSAVNKKIHLECQVDEDRKVTVGWTKDGNKIPPGKDYKIYFEDKIASLEIPLAKLKDSGHYVCTASNEAGSSSSSASITVRGKLVLHSLYFCSSWVPHFFFCRQKTSLVICRRSGAPPPPPPFFFPLFFPFSSPFFPFLEPPSFVKKIDPSYLLTPGDSARLQCKIKGSPEIQVTWFKNNKEIRESNTHRMSFVNSVAVLDILEMKVDDSGSYSCEAVNEVGSDSCATEVVVKGLLFLLLPVTFLRKPFPSWFVVFFFVCLFLVFFFFLAQLTNSFLLLL